MAELRLTVNGGEHVLDAPVGRSLAHVLREELGLTGTKIACNEGHCGACTVQVDGVPRLSCITLAHAVDGDVTTIEGLREHPLVEAFARARGTSMTALALAWLLADQRVTQVVIGPGRSEHLEPVREALTYPLTADELAQVEDLV